MRIPAFLLLIGVAMLVPNVVTADPAQQGPAVAVAPAAAPLPSSATPQGAGATVPAEEPAKANPGETVIVTGKVQDDPGSLDRIVCKDLPPEIGSRLGGSRKCLTVRQWNDRQKESQGVLNNIQMRGLSLGYGH